MEYTPHFGSRSTKVLDCAIEKTMEYTPHFGSRST